MARQQSPEIVNVPALTDEPNEQGFAPLRFDPTEYLHYVEDMDLTEAQALELLETIWAIMVAWVDLGFGVNPIQQAMDKSGNDGGSSPSGVPDVIGSWNEVSENNKNGHTERANGREAVKEES